MSKTSQTTNRPTRIVVLGSGYGGIHATKTLLEQADSDENIEVVLLSKTDHLLYVTMIYEVVAGNLAPSSIRQSVRTTLADRRLSFLQGTVQAVDCDTQTVTYAAKTGEEAELQYDYLISAIGSETNFYDVPGAAEHAYTLKTLPDAKELKNHLLDQFNRAADATSASRRRELLSVVVVGGGPTGVTLAAKINDLLADELSASFPELSRQAQVTIVEAADRPLVRLSPWFSRRAAAALARKGIRLLTNHRATEVRAGGVQLGDEFLPSQTVIWTAGVQAREFTIEAEKSISRDEPSRRIHVTETLQIPAYKNIFVAGDQAWVDRGERGPYPMRAQFAVRQGQQAGENVLRLLRGTSPARFAWQDKGLVVSVGEGYTYAEVGGFRLSGWPATLAYKSIYLLSTIGVRAKLRALLEWGMNLFLPRDVSEL